MTAFEDRLRARLVDVARLRPVTETDWSRVTAKLAAASPGASGSGASDDRAHRSVGASGGSRWRRWHVPLWAAAAVVIVAGAAVAVVTLGSDGGRTIPPAAPNGTAGSGLVFAYHPDSNGGDDALLAGTVTDLGGCLVIAAGASITVPVFPVPSTDPAGLRVGDRVSLGGGFTDVDRLPADVVIPDECRRAGSGHGEFFIAWTMDILGAEQPSDDDASADIPPASVAPTTESAPDRTEPVTVRVDSAWAADAPQQLFLSLSGGVLRVTSEDSDDNLGDDLYPDTSPLGYVRAAPERDEGWAAIGTDGTYANGVIRPPGNRGGMYLYGVVGPAVDRIAVLANDAEAADLGGGTGYEGATLVWVVADTGDPAGSDGRGARTLWTDIAEGWRAFAVQLPAPSRALIALAFGSDRTLLQARQYTTDGYVAELSTALAPDLDMWDPEEPAPRFGPDGPNGASGPYVATYPDIPDQPAHAALLEGVIGVQDGCVVVRGADDEPITLLFPQSQVDAATSPALVMFRGHEYRDGETIAVGGSESAATDGDVAAVCPIRVWSVSPY